MENYLGSIEQDLSSLSRNEYVRQALKDFDAGWKDLKENQTVKLQSLYIDNNPHPTGSKDELDYADDGSSYSRYHKQYHPWFRHFLRQRDYYDIFLFNTNGDLVYTVFKELDYATNLNSGQWKNSDLGNAFRAARDNPQIDNQSFFDFRPYAPSHGAAASFISQPVLNDDGSLAGVLVFQMPIARINGVMQVAAGMGESGETYLVGDDFLMRSDSRFSDESTILKTKVDGETVRLALAGKEGVQIVPDYRGIPVVSAYGPIDFHGVRWAVLAEIDEAEVQKPISAMRNTVITFVAIAIAVIAIIAFFAARTFSRPIAQIARSMNALADNNLNVEIPGLGRGDEIGDMANNVKIFKENAIQARKLEEEKVESEKRAQQEKRETMENLATDLEEKVGGVIESVSSATSNLQSTARNLSAIAEKGSSQAGTLSAASDSASNNVNTVASAAEELTASIGEINQQVSRSSEIAQTAVDKAKSANEVIGGLVGSSEKIGQVSELINDIAEQINLLALNATIEAARAGEAGKGFAVVASEVKNLATQTANATSEIAGHIAETQNQTKNTAEALEEIGKTIDEMSSISTTISTAMEEQGAATQEIARSIQHAAQSTNEVSSTVGGVSDASSQTGEAATNMNDAVDELAKQSNTLKNEIDSFLKNIRAA